MSTVKLTEIAQYLMDRNGQFVIGGGDFADLEWNLESFWRVMKREIDKYENYVPLQKTFNIDVYGDRVYDFTLDPNNSGYVDSDNPGLPPKFITSVVPVNTITLISTLGGLPSPMVRGRFDPNRVVEPRPFLWDYKNKPKLNLTESGRFEVIANYKYAVTETRDNAVLTEVEIENLDYDDNYQFLLDLMSGRFLLSIGRSRRAFTYTDMPIIADAADLIREGEQEYETALKNIRENHHWYDSVRAG